MRFRKAYPPNASALNPEVENWFGLYIDGVEAEKIIRRAGEYAAYWKHREPGRYPHGRHMKQAINWLREACYEIDWSAKLAAEKQGDKTEEQVKRDGEMQRLGKVAKATVERLEREADEATAAAGNE